MIKWKLMLTTLPIVIFVVVVKFALENVYEFQGAIEFSDISAILTAGAFLIGFMLTGTMSDYKESEKLPADLACTLEVLEDIIKTSEHLSSPHCATMQESLLAMTTAITNWLARKTNVEQVYAAISATGTECGKLVGVNTTLWGRFNTELHNLRKTITRIDVISRTGFLPTGYAILEVMVCSIIILMVAAKYKSGISEYILIGFVTLVYTYLLRLIRDVDDPFEYSDDLTQRKGAAEVDLFPLLGYVKRATARLKRY